MKKAAATCNDQYGLICPLIPMGVPGADPARRAAPTNPGKASIYSGLAPASGAARITRHDVGGRRRTGERPPPSPGRLGRS